MLKGTCKFVKTDRTACTWPLEKSLEYCWVHDPINPPFLFLESYGKFSVGPYTMSKRKAGYYIRKGVAIKATEEVIDKYSKHILEGLKKISDNFDKEAVEHIMIGDKDYFRSGNTSAIPAEIKYISRLLENPTLKKSDKVFLKELLKDRGDTRTGGPSLPQEPSA